MKGFILFILAALVIYVACDFQSPVDFGLGLSAPSPKATTGASCIIVQWSCDSDSWMTREDSTFSVFYKNFLIHTGGEVPIVTEFISEDSKKVYLSGRPGGHHAIFVASGSSCGLWSTVFSDATAEVKVFKGEVDWRYRNLPAHSEYVLVEDGEKYRVARVNTDTTLNYTDYYSFHGRDHRPSSFEGQFYHPVNLRYETPYLWCSPDPIPAPPPPPDRNTNPDPVQSPPGLPATLLQYIGPSNFADVGNMLRAISNQVLEYAAQAVTGQEVCESSGGVWLEADTDSNGNPRPARCGYRDVLNEACLNKGGRYRGNGDCIEQTVVAESAANKSACEDDGGTYARNKCFSYKRNRVYPGMDQATCESHSGGEWTAGEGCKFDNARHAPCPDYCPSPTPGTSTSSHSCYNGFTCSKPLEITSEAKSDIAPLVGSSNTQLAYDCNASSGTWANGACECNSGLSSGPGRLWKTISVAGRLKGYMLWNSRAF